MKELRFTLAIQKSGRLSDGSLSLLKKCGIGIQNGTNHLKARGTGFPIDLIFLRDDDIPQYVADGVADAGILGLNEVIEKNVRVNTVSQLGFSRCRLSVAIPRDQTYTGAGFLSGKRIATSYPGILKKYLSEKNISADIHPISGSVEVTPGLGLADAIFEIVSSGGTLLGNGLKEVETFLHSEAVMIANPELPEEKRALLEQLLFRIKAVQTAGNNKYILLNAPNDNMEAIAALIPGMKSPTILPLAMEGWSSMHSVISENDFWEVIDKLKAAGAQGILVVPIEKMVV
jgi:ATP phosphoribosyltransferase